MVRSLTEEEFNVLAHVVEDPDAWWSHAAIALGGTAEEALLNKVDRWKPSYVEAVLAPNYKTRAQKILEEGGI